MPVRLVVAVTDIDWCRHLSQMPDLAEVNFWSPSPKNFKALAPGELFLFKLHAPVDMIVGGGVFAHANTMPLSLAFSVFRSTHTGEGGPVAPTGNPVAAEYVYAMEFDSGKIRHMTKIWNDGHSLKQLGWA